MRNWHSLYEILYFPICVMLAAQVLLGLGNLLTNEVFESFIQIDNEFITLLAQTGMRLGTFLLVNFPLLFLIRLVARKNGSATTIISAFSGYVVFQIVTMYFATSSMPTTAYSSILGISFTAASTALMSGGVHYPLQTGLTATAIVSIITLRSYSRSRIRSEYGFFSFISKDTFCVIRTMFFSTIFGIIIAYIWPYIIEALQAAITYIASDTTNPANLAVFGIMERMLSVLNLGTIIRSPFWYGTSGGSWISMAGTNIAGDVNIWTAQLAAGSISGMTGRFITPYYVLNMFAIPGLLWGMYSMQTDRLERRRTRMLYILVTAMSLLSGTLLPVELMLFFLCPLLFLFHIGYTGVLFGVFQSMHTYLGFNYSGTSTITAMPGTLLEYLSYIGNSSLTDTLIKILIVGGISFLIYFFFTRLYFRRLALDVFHTGGKDRLVMGTVEALGGIENVKLIHSSADRVVVSLYDPTKLNVNKLRELGSIRITETRAGYSIAYGAASTMVRIGIIEYMRDSIRSVNR